MALLLSLPLDYLLFFYPFTIFCVVENLDVLLIFHIGSWRPGLFTSLRKKDVIQLGWAIRWFNYEEEILTWIVGFAASWG